MHALRGHPSAGAPSRRRGFFGVWLARVLFPLLLPGLLMQLWTAAPAAANAITEDWQAVEFEFEPGFQQAVSCGMSVGWTEVDQVVVTPGLCVSGVDTPGYGDYAEGGSDYSYNVTCADDDGEHPSIPFLGVFEDDPDANFLHRMGRTDRHVLILGGTPGDCVPVEMCMTIWQDPPVPGISDPTSLTLCNPLELTPPAEYQVPSNCLQGGIQSVSVSAPRKPDPDHAYVDVTVRFNELTKVGPSYPWRLTFVIAPPGGAPSTSNSLRGPHTVMGDRTVTKTIQVAQYPVPADPAQYTQVLGVMGYPAYDYWDDYASPPGLGQHEFNETALPPTGILGTKDDSKCRYYFGTKIANVPDSEIDEPTGGLNGATTPVEDPRDPEPEAPPSNVTDPDEQSWWAAVLAALAAIVAAILIIPNMILRGLGDVLQTFGTWFLTQLQTLLETLFVPPDAPSFTDVASPLPPGWLPDLPNLGGAQCGGLTFPRVDLGYRDWGVGPITFADTCDDPWPLVRTFTYNGLLALVLVGAVWSAFRSITSGLGMGVSSGSGDDE